MRLVAVRLECGDVQVFAFRNHLGAQLFANDCLAQGWDAAISQSIDARRVGEFERVGVGEADPVVTMPHSFPKPRKRGSRKCTD